MTTSIRSYLSATLTREQQFVILVFGLCLTGLVAWRAGLIWRPPPPSNPTHQKYFIDIIGNTSRPGLQVFLSPPTLEEIWKSTGSPGTLGNAHQTLSSGTQITVGPEKAVILKRMPGSELLTLGLTLDPNLASISDLEAIPGIGPVLANRIVAYREEHGPFQNIENLLEVKGIGPKILEKIKPYVVIIAESQMSP